MKDFDYWKFLEDDMTTIRHRIKYKGLKRIDLFGYEDEPLFKDDKKIKIVNFFWKRSEMYGYNTYDTNGYTEETYILSGITTVDDDRILLFDWKLEEWDHTFPFSNILEKAEYKNLDEIMITAMEREKDVVHAAAELHAAFRNIIQTMDALIELNSSNN